MKSSEPWSKLLVLKAGQPFDKDAADARSFDHHSSMPFIVNGVLDPRAEDWPPRRDIGKQSSGRYHCCCHLLLHSILYILSML